MNRYADGEEQRPMQSIILSRPMLAPTISDLSVGQSAFAPPSALFVTSERGCRIQTNVPVRPASDAHASMQVTRTAQGYVADVSYCHYCWELSAETADGVPHAPLLHIVYGDEFLQ